MKECDLKKTIFEWSSEFDIIVYDPDGFDRKDPNLFNNKYTYSEFIQGLMSSTTMPTNKHKYTSFTDACEQVKKRLELE